MNYKKKLKFVHFCLLALLVLNFFVSFYISLTATLLIILKALFYLTGIVLFFYSLKPFKKRAVYFAFYVFSPVIAYTAWLLDGIFGAVLTSFLLFFFWPDTAVYNKNDIKVYPAFTGFLGSCCAYEIREPKFLLFEQKTGEFEFDEGFDFKNSQITIENDSVRIQNYTMESGPHFQRDTVIKIE